MRDIADASGLSPGNLYYYFKGKQEILYFCQERALEQMLASLEQAQNQDGDVAPRLFTLIHAHVCCLLDELEDSVEHLMISGLPPELRDQLIDKRDRYEKGIRKLIQKGVDRGEFSTEDSALVTRAILGAANWTSQWFNPDGSQSVAEIADTMAAYLVQGLVASDGESIA